MPSCTGSHGSRMEGGGLGFGEMKKIKNVIFMNFMN